MSTNDERRYGRWAGNPEGVPENEANCVQELYNRNDWHFYQCSRKRGHGPNGEYCRQHAKWHDKR